ncbi:ABC transporter ATP-binding protein [Arhodomonas sp. SL1]|uniref:ABC transporter ATP-binding protein n=1 Tax=Arhodomonas sp. SL1 TaxID=3425691 RepID=UPI003F882086
MLEISGLTAGYGRLTALREASLSVAEGEVVFVVGPNGAGKSTLLKSLAGLVKPVSGEVRFRGSQVTRQQPEQLCRQGLILIPEGRHIFGSLTVQENLTLAATTRRDRKAVQEDLDFVQTLFPILRARYKGVAGHLSGGEQQQLAIARAILQKPSLLMIDEPSLGLAPLVIDQVYESLRELNNRGLTLLIVEQSTGWMMNIASRAYILRGGQVVLEGSTDELSDPERLEAAYFGH